MQASSTTFLALALAMVMFMFVLAFALLHGFIGGGSRKSQRTWQRFT
jgi:hypothetical protein